MGSTKSPTIRGLDGPASAFAETHCDEVGEESRQSRVSVTAPYMVFWRGMTR